MALDRKEVGNAIKRRREQLGYTIDTTQHRITEEYISRATLLRIEEGHPNVSLSKIRLEMEALQMNPADYMDINALFDSSLTSYVLQRRLDIFRILFPAESLGVDAPIRCLGDFPNFLHLFDFDALADMVTRITGCVVGYEEYDMRRIQELYEEIPNSPAKEYADKLRGQNCADYFNSIYSTQAQISDNDLHEELFIEEEQNRFDAHLNAVRSYADRLRRVKLYTREYGDRSVYVEAVKDKAFGGVRFHADDKTIYWYNIRVPLWKYVSPGCRVIVEKDGSYCDGTLTMLMVGDSLSEAEELLETLPEQDIVSVYTKFPMDKIFIPPAFDANPPAEEKILHQRHEWLTYGHFKTKVLIRSDGLLRDGYSAYLAAVRLNLPFIYCRVVPETPAEIAAY